MLGKKSQMSLDTAKSDYNKTGDDHRLCKRTEVIKTFKISTNN